MASAETVKLPKDREGQTLHIGDEVFVFNGTDPSAQGEVVSTSQGSGMASSSLPDALNAALRSWECRAPKTGAQKMETERVRRMMRRSRRQQVRALLLDAAIAAMMIRDALRRRCAGIRMAHARRRQGRR